MNKYTNRIWWWTDSNVYLENGTLRKYYMHISALNDDLILNLKSRNTNLESKPWHLSENNIKSYHKFHTDLSKFNFYFDLEKPIDSINWIIIKVLDLADAKISNGSLIINRARIIVTEPTNVETDPGIYQKVWNIYNTNHRKIHDLINIYFKKIWLKALTNIHPEKNYKLTWYQDWIIKLTITDIWNDIYSLIQREANTINRWIENNKWKDSKDYKPSPKIKRKRINSNH